MTSAVSDAAALMGESATLLFLESLLGEPCHGFGFLQALPGFQLIIAHVMKRKCLEPKGLDLRT